MIENYIFSIARNFNLRKHLTKSSYPQNLQQIPNFALAKLDLTRYYIGMMVTSRSYTKTSKHPLNFLARTLSLPLIVCGLVLLLTCAINLHSVNAAEITVETLKIQTLDNYDKILNAKEDAEILADPELKLQLLQRTLVSRVGYDKLVTFAGQSENNLKMLQWLFLDADNLEKYLLGGTPEGGETKYTTSLDVLSKLYQKYGADLEDGAHKETYRTMMMAISLAYGSDVNGWQTANDNNKSPWITHKRTPSEPLDRYQVLKELLTTDIVHEDIHTSFDKATFEDLEVEEMRWVVNNRINDKEIPWLNWYTQKVKEGKTGYGKEGYMNPYNYIYYDGGFNWYYEDPGYYQIDSTYCAEDNGNLSKVHSGDKYKRGANCNKKYGLNYFGLETATTSPLRLWTIWEEDGVCGSIAGVGTNIQMAYGIPSSLVSQPGHAAYYQSQVKDFNNQKLRFWSINNSCASWANSYKGERMPLNWGTRVKNGWSDWNNASYLLVAQRAIDNYDSMKNAFYYDWIAGARTDTTQKISSYENAIHAMEYDIDAWYNLVQIALKDPNLGEEDYFRFATSIMDHLKEFPLPMYDLLKLIMDKMGVRQVAYVHKLDTVLEELKSLKDSTSPYLQTQAIRDIANYILNNTGDTDIAEFSFDGDHAMQLRLRNGPRDAASPFEYSYKTDLSKYQDTDLVNDNDNWTNVTDGRVDIDLTGHEQEMSPDRDILVHLGNTPRTKENIFVVKLEQGKKDDIRANNLERKFMGVKDDQAEWVMVDFNDMDQVAKLFDENRNNELNWTKLSDKYPEISDEGNEGEYNLYLRKTYTGIYTPSGAQNVEFSAKPDNPEQDYIPVSELSVASSLEDQSEDTELPKLLDGDIFDYWQNNPDDERKYLIYTLAKPQHISKMQYVLYQNPNNYSWGHIEEAQIEASLDGEHYWTVSDSVKWKDNANNQNVDQPRTYTFDFIPDQSFYAKYIKITPLQIKDNNSNVRVSMFNFFRDTINSKVDISQLEGLMEFDIGEYTYDGTEHRPTVVKIGDYDGSTLVLGQDYEVTYGNNINPGTGLIKITGKGDKYQGTFTKEFIINPAKQPSNPSGSDPSNPSGSGTSSPSTNPNSSNSTNSTSDTSGASDTSNTTSNDPNSPDTGANTTVNPGATASIAVIATTSLILIVTTYVIYRKRHRHGK